MNTDPESIRPDLEKVLRQAFPENQILGSFDSEDSYFTGLYDKLRHRLSQIKDTEICYERDCDGVEESPYISPGAEAAGWDSEEEDLNGAPAGEPEFVSYHSFFLVPAGDKFTYPCAAEDEMEGEPEKEAESDEDDLQPENGEREREDDASLDDFDPLAPDPKDPWEDDAATEPSGAGQGRVGCLVVVSLLAPVALVKLEVLETYENGAYEAPRLEAVFLNQDGAVTDPKDELRELVGEDGLLTLQALQDQIQNVLRTCKIELLPPEEARKEVAWLKPGDASSLAEGEKVTVQAAFFHQIY